MLSFHLGIDQQDRIWVTNGGSDHVVRFAASDPTKVETFKAGYSETRPPGFKTGDQIGPPGGYVGGACNR